MRLVDATILAEGRQNWISAVTERYLARLGLLQSKPSHEPDEVLQLFEMVVDDKHRDQLVGYLRSDPEVSEFHITNSSRGRLTGLIRARGVISRCIADSDCFLLYASNESGAMIAWRVLGAERSFKRLLDRLEKKGIEYSIGGLSIVSSRSRVTARQEEVLRVAFDEGYFDDPKRVTIRELARLLGVSPPTVHESLRRTQRKILGEHLKSSQTTAG